MRAPARLRAAVQRLEQDRRVDRVASGLRPAADTLADGSAGDALAGQWLGHALHPLLTDLPLGCWIGAGLLDVVGGRASRRSAQRLVGLGLLAVPVTVASGVVDWSKISDERAARVGVAHAGGNTVVAGLYLASWLARRRDRQGLGVMAALAGGGLAVVTGYLGGHLSFARGVGVGARGLDDQDAAPIDTAGEGFTADGDLVDAEGAMSVLGVGREQLDAMVSDDLLVVRSDEGDGPRFARSDLIAVRMVGG